MRIDHRGPDVAVAQKLLDRADVVIGLQKMRRERVPERVAGDSLGQFSLSDGFVQRLLDMRVVKMISTQLLRIRHEGQKTAVGNTIARCYPSLRKDMSLHCLHGMNAIRYVKVFCRVLPE